MPNAAAPTPAAYAAPPKAAAAGSNAHPPRRMAAPPTIQTAIPPLTHTHGAILSMRLEERISPRPDASVPVLPRTNGNVRFQTVDAPVFKLVYVREKFSPVESVCTNAREQGTPWTVRYAVLVAPEASFVMVNGIVEETLNVPVRELSTGTYPQHSQLDSPIRFRCKP